MNKIAILLALLLCVSCKTIWKAPMMEYEENDSPKVLSVEFRDTATIIEMEKKIGYGFTVSDATVLVTDSMNTSTLRWKRNLEPFMGYYSDATVRFTLGFNALPKSTKRLDFVEGSNERDYRIWGLHPQKHPLVSHTYNPIRVGFNDEEKAFLTKLLVHHIGKVIVLQILNDIDDLESVELLERTIHAREELTDDLRISFVTFSNPDGKEGEKEDNHAILLGKNATYMEHISKQDYDRLVHLVSPHLAEDKTVCFDQKLQILKPGLVFNSSKLLEFQLELLSK